jgi:rhombotail lipoprotein
MRVCSWLALIVILGLSGCADLACLSMRCQRHAHNSTSLVEFLYPNGSPPPAENSQPQLHLPLRVGLAFLPSNSGAENALDAAHKDELMQEIRKRFISRKFIAEIVVIPDYYLQGKSGFEGLQGVQRLYGIDLMALVSYDQVTHEDDNNWSLGYVTIVGAYFLKGTRHDLSTLVDLAVVDPVTRSLVLRAGGVDSSHGTVTLMRESRELREASAKGFAAATAQMIDHFDSALTAFEGDVREGKANVKVVSNHGKPTVGGGGAVDWLGLLFLIPAAAAAARRRLDAHPNRSRPNALDAGGSLNFRIPGDQRQVQHDRSGCY